MRGRLLQLWRRADPELQPVIGEVRRRLAGRGRAGSRHCRATSSIAAANAFGAS